MRSILVIADFDQDSQEITFTRSNPPPLSYRQSISVKQMTWINDCSSTTPKAINYVPLICALASITMSMVHSAG